MSSVVTVTFLPSGQKADSIKGRTILDVAKVAKEPLHYECDGLMTCGTCVVQVLEGNLSKISGAEQAHLDRLHEAHHGARLSCQARLIGHATIRLIERAKDVR